MQDIIRENFGGDRNTFIKTLQAQNYSLGEVQEDGERKNDRAGDAAQEREVNTIISPNQDSGILPQACRRIHEQGAGQIAHDHDPGRHVRSGPGQKAMAEEILGKLVNGAEFDRMAQIYSEDSTRDLGGDWGWIDRRTLAAPLEKVAFNLRPGKVSNIIELGGNYYILKVEDRQRRRYPPFRRSSRRDREKTDQRRSAGQAGTLARQSAPESLHKDVLRFES